MATTTPISIGEYLSGLSGKPDCEYLDGYLKERPMVKRMHGRLQSLLSLWFGQHEDLWNIEVVVGVCTQVSETRVRLPDVVVDWEGDRPDILVDPPLLVIEIIFSDDSYSETQRLAQDYLAMGIPNIWILDPETETARSCEGKTWAEKTRLEIAGTPIYVDVNELFAKLRRARPHQEASI